MYVCMCCWYLHSPVMSSSGLIWSPLWVIMKQCRGSMECQSNAVALLWFTQTHLNVIGNRKRKQKPGCRDGFLGKALVILNLRNQVEPASPALLWQVRDRDRRPISACEPASLEKPTENSKGPVPESRRPLTVSHIHLMHISLPFYTEIWVHRHTDFRNPSRHVCQELHHLFHLETRRGLWRWLIVFYFSSHSTHLPSLSIERKKRHLLYSACT